MLLSKLGSTNSLGPKRAGQVSSLLFCIRFHFIHDPEIMYDFSTAKDQDDIVTVPMEGLMRFMELNADRSRCDGLTS
jgi:hypothetical protein